MTIANLNGAFRKGLKPFTAPEWHGIPMHRRYVIDGVRYAEVWRDGRNVIVPLHEIGDAELAQLRGAA